MTSISMARLKGIPQKGVREVVTIPAAHFGSMCSLQVNWNVRCGSWVLWQSVRQKLMEAEGFSSPLSLSKWDVMQRCYALLREIFLLWVLTFASTFTCFLCPLTKLFVLLIILITPFSSSFSADTFVLMINYEECTAIQMSSHRHLPHLHYYFQTGEIFYNACVMWHDSSCLSYCAIIPERTSYYALWSIRSLGLVQIKTGRNAQEIIQHRISYYLLKPFRPF